MESADQGSSTGVRAGHQREIKSLKLCMRKYCYAKNHDRYPKDSSKPEMLKSIFCLAFIALTTLTSGCATINGPKPFEDSVDSMAQLTAMAQYGPTSKSYAENKEETGRKNIRDQFLTAKLAIVDIRFMQFARNLSADKKALDAATESVQFTLGVAATLVGGTQAKENLAAAIALVTAGKTSIDKHYFNNQAATAILSTMVALRKERFVRLYAGMQAPTDEYPLVLAKQDLDNYEAAGTLDGAVLSIQADAIARESQATDRIDFLSSVVRNIPKNLSPTKRADKAAMTRALDPKKLTAEKTEAALKALGQERIPSALDEQIRLLQLAVRQARSDDAVDTIKAAFDHAGITP